jgi:hypothetical protein
MKLVLRRNHFFRSFWSIEKVNVFTTTHMKYFDLDALNACMYNNWRYNSKYSETRILYSDNSKVDLSYWNTYAVGIDNDTLFKLLNYDYVRRMDNIYGVKNFRTDNMSDNDFDMMLDIIDIEHFNDNWKTSHLDVGYPISIHWNFYTARERAKRFRDTDSDSDNEFFICKVSNSH